MEDSPMACPLCLLPLVGTQDMWGVGTLAETPSDVLEATPSCTQGTFPARSLG